MGFYNTASAADNGELLIQLVGVMNDPFAVADGYDGIHSFP